MKEEENKIVVPVPKPRNNLWKKRGTIRHKNKKKQLPNEKYFE